MHEGVVGGHFAIDITTKKKIGCRILVANFVRGYSWFLQKMWQLLKNWRIKNKKFDQVGKNISRRTFYELGSKFYRSNQTNKNTNRKQIYFGNYKLCNQVGRSKKLWTNIVVVTTIFLYEYILTRFGCPLTIVTYQEVHFINYKIKHLTT